MLALLGVVGGLLEQCQTLLTLGTTGNGWCFVGMMPNFVDARHYWEWLVLCWNDAKLC